MTRIVFLFSEPLPHQCSSLGSSPLTAHGRKPRNSSLCRRNEYTIFVLGLGCRNSGEPLTQKNHVQGIHLLIDLEIIGDFNASEFAAGAFTLHASITLCGEDTEEVANLSAIDGSMYEQTPFPYTTRVTYRSKLESNEGNFED